MESQHARILKRLLAERRQALLESLVSGTFVEPNWHKEVIGRINGLDEAVRLSDDADYEISGGSQ